MVAGTSSGGGERPELLHISYTTSIGVAHCTRMPPVVDQRIVFSRAVWTTENAPPRAERFWGYYREERSRSHRSGMRKTAWLSQMPSGCCRLIPLVWGSDCGTTVARILVAWLEPWRRT